MYSIFYNDGTIGYIDNLEGYLTLQIDEDIEKTLIINQYYHKLNLMVVECIRRGVMEQVEGKPYEPIHIEKTINHIKKFMVDNYKYSEEQFKAIEAKVDSMINIKM